MNVYAVPVEFERSAIFNLLSKKKYIQGVCNWNNIHNIIPYFIFTSVGQFMFHKCLLT